MKGKMPICTFVAYVVYSIPQRKIEAVIFAPAGSNVPQVSSSGEVFPVLVEGDRHDPVGGVEGLLDAVPMVDVNINVQHPLVVPGSEGQGRQS